MSSEKVIVAITEEAARAYETAPLPIQTGVSAILRLWVTDIPDQIKHHAMIKALKEYGAEQQREIVDIVELITGLGRSREIQ